MAASARAFWISSSRSAASRVVGFFGVDDGGLGLDPSQLVGPLGLDDHLLGLDLLLVELGQGQLLARFFLDAALLHPDFAFLARLLRLGLGIGLQLVLARLLGLQPQLHDAVEAGLHLR